ncbi:MAG TPA: hypothetical protein VN717_00225 [Gemmatimonadaceae bacterium]|nr:hypothetical protein [Gemmatimonadaceae bacterium]
MSGRYAVRLLVLAGGMMVACENTRDASASKAEVGRPAMRAQTISNGAPRRDSVAGFTVPAQCARGSIPVPRKPALAHADSIRVASAGVDTAPKSPKAARADSIARARARVRADSLAVIALQTDSAATHRLPGSIFPGCRVVAYYGNPMSKRMGILGEINSDSMLARLAKQAAAYAAVDSTRPVLPALELIATVAQAGPGQSGLYRARMPDTLIERVMGWAEAHHYLVILDIQTGRSTMAAEMVPLMKYLSRPYVHLALDPEFSIGTKRVPGKVIGRIDAADVNAVSSVLAALVDSLALPPKMLIVHRFTTPMLSNHEKIRLDPRVQIVIDMDGFGPPRLKYGSYKAYVHDRPVQFAGFKVFYKNDKPMLTPAQVLELDPVPLFVMYQ